MNRKIFILLWVITFIVVLLLYLGKDIYYLLFPEAWHPTEGYDNTYEVYIGQGVVVGQGSGVASDYAPPDPTEVAVGVPFIILVSYIITRFIRSVVEKLKGEDY